MGAESGTSQRRRARIASLADTRATAALAICLIAAGLAPAAAAAAPKHPRRFVAVAARNLHGGVAVTVRLTALPDLRFIVTLNGKRVTDQFSIRRPLRRTAVLDAADGVRHGLNLIRVTARSSQGHRGTTSAKVRIAQTQPLLANGPNVRGVPRRRVRLSGRLMTLIPGGVRPRYRWRVMSKPRGSRPRFADPRSATTSFRPERPGVYRLRLTARVGRRTAVDEVTDTTTPNYPPLGAPVQTMANDGQAITIGAQTYPFNPNAGSGCNALNVVVLDRQTSAVAYSGTLSGSAGSALNLLFILASILQNDQVDAHPIVIISDTANNPTGPNCEAVASQWGFIVTDIGGEPIPSISNGNGGWSIIGTWKTTPGTAWENDGSDQVGQVLAGGLDGYLQYDGVSAYAFVPSQRLEADLDAPGAPNGQNTIALGPGSYPSGALACGTGGFQVVAINAVSLSLVSNQTFATNGCGSQDLTNVDHMIGDLNGLANSSDPAQLLVAVQSIGTPYDGTDDGIVWPLLDQAVSGVGATSGVLAADQQGYSLLGGVGIGALPLAEASQTAIGAPAHVTAVLERGRSWAYVPALSSPSGSFGLGLALLAYQTPQPFDPSTGQLHALWYIDAYLDIPAQTTGTECYAPSQAMPDVRYAYCDPSLAGQFGNWSTTVENVPYPSATYFQTHPNASFTNAQLTAVEDQLGPSARNPGEFSEVQEVDEVIQSIQTGVDGGSGTALAIAAQEASTIQTAIAQINRKTNSFSTGIFLDIVGNLLTLAGAGTVIDFADATKNAINTLSAATLLGEDVANTANGEPALGNFSVQVSDFNETLAARYQDVGASLQHLADLIVTDPGKLHTFWNNSASYTYVNSVQLDNASQLAAAQFSWTGLLPTAFELAELPRSGSNSGVTDARDYTCSYSLDKTSQSYHPFPNAPLSSQVLSNHLYTLVENGSALPDDHLVKETPKTPPATLTDPLFAPYATANGVITQFGLYKPWFYRGAYDEAAAPAVANCP